MVVHFIYFPLTSVIDLSLDDNWTNTQFQGQSMESVENSLSHFFIDRKVKCFID